MMEAAGYLGAGGPGFCAMRSVISATTDMSAGFSRTFFKSAMCRATVSRSSTGWVKVNFNNSRPCSQNKQDTFAGASATTGKYREAHWWWALWIKHRTQKHSTHGEMRWQQVAFVIVASNQGWIQWKNPKRQDRINEERTEFGELVTPGASCYP